MANKMRTFSDLINTNHNINVNHPTENHNKRKRHDGLEYPQPVYKRQRVFDDMATQKQTIHTYLSSQSLSQQSRSAYTAATDDDNLLNDDDLFIDTTSNFVASPTKSESIHFRHENEEDEADEEDEQDTDDDDSYDEDDDLSYHENHNTLNDSLSYKTPANTSKLHLDSTAIANQHDISFSSSNCSLSVSTHDDGYECSAESDANHSINDRCGKPSICRASENALSVIYAYLTFNEILAMSKTCRMFWDQSFELVSRLTVRCKSVRGVDSKNINRLISRCSSYLKYLDLSNVAVFVTNSSMLNISEYCTKLTFVSLHGCSNICDEALVSFLDSCVVLKELDLSGCAQITASIGESLVKCTKLKSLNLAWCTEVDSNIVPYLVYLNQNHSLRNVNLHCCNKYITLYYAFKHVFDSIEQRKGLKSFRLKNELFIIGGLQKKTLNVENLEDHIKYLQGKGVVYTDPESLNLRSISEYDFKYKMDLLLKSQRISSEMADFSCNVKKRGYRLYTVSKTDKIYMVIESEYGVFGTKLIPGQDFESPRNEYMAALQRSNRNPIEYLKQECDVANWSWIDEFQSKRCLSLLGMHKSANW
eukprot:CAMPEP_0197050590 /NCGR_PEP_ID=MMETSP1384-20130603/25442_1 /TAXON_ID=29189 /ORGANISM="Ammonia sp." /LENGTH=590 /DNA_ID=CAMNT_0042483017 /DNA_START=40 /DNA_END=1809 /DNA_ORIENTATION=+